MAGKTMAENDKIPTLEIEQKSEENLVDGLTKDQQILITKELLRKTPEYKICWELELWKKQEKHKFKEWLKKTKNLQIKKFSEESKQKEKKLKKIYFDKQKELENLENQLNKTIKEVNERENQVKFFEKELRRRKIEIESDFKRKVRDVEHKNELLKEECRHKLSLLNSTVVEKQNEIEKLKKKNEMLNLKTEKLSEKTQDLQEKYINTNYKQLLSENGNLKKNLEEVLDEKNKYKNEYKKQLKLVIKLKKIHENRTQKLLDKIIFLQEKYQESLILKQNESRLGNKTIENDNKSINETLVEEKELDSLKLQLENIKTSFQKFREQKTEQIETKKKKIKKFYKAEREKNENKNDNISTNSTIDELTNSFEEKDNPLMGSPQKTKRVFKKRVEDKFSIIPPMQGNNEEKELIFVEDRNEGEEELRRRKEEIRNLTRKKAELMQTGNYDDQSELIIKIDKRLNEII